MKFNLKKNKKSANLLWGKQEYNGIFRSLEYDKQIDINNRKKKRSFIKEFVTHFISGAFLKNQEKTHTFKQ
ncbi:hypothetical protein [Aureibacter tunicatorum]|uniref:Uncharacterized protein n=1 Tax=Aureibacter tunicatorum TaxID=866807 RepID=A0AAE4BTD5_9BACT|nr:hypothetical protein [Aureibacter tunicatorum]MDR6239728.1 hypothetical protein [Aureibacter tunicatorum]BDD04204.1 hypothetical protein AUTU_16870 [Aureibacter tunicatorum]